MTLARKKLDDLFRVGKEYDIAPDGASEPFMVYVRKLGPTQQTTSARQANSARMEFYLDARNEESGYHRTLVAQVAEIDLENKIRQLAMTEIAEDRQKLEQEISGRPEWSEDGKLQTLVDMWEDGLMKDWLMGEEERSEESVRVFEEMKKFTDEVDQRLQALLDIEMKKIEEKGEDWIDKKMISSQIEFDANAEWIKMFRMHQIMFGTRDIDTGEQIWDSIDQIEDLAAELFGKLSKAVIDLNVPITEVKS